MDGASMCGIIGMAALRATRDYGALERQRDTMTHRGPDDAGAWWSADRRVGLGHRRLSIIDLSAAGHQPMQYAGGRICVAFNGEIYNYNELRMELASKGHAFSSLSDTEVLLAAYLEWGTACLDRLDGMFAFGLCDTHKGLLFLARDRAGEKPLFYAQSQGVFWFASELKALLHNPSFPRQLDPEALDCYLGLGFVPGDRCIVRGARKLPPGHALTLDLDSHRMEVWPYWTLPALRESGPAVADTNGQALLDELEGLLEASVRRQLVADVPVGVLLSGGVDSALVTAMAVRAADRIRTFTVRMPGHPTLDETAHARLVSRHFGTDHVELVAEPSTVDLLPLLARQFDEPLVDSSMVPTYLLCRLVRQHCTVAIGGDGGDELFGGYGHYDRLLRMQRLVGWVPRCARRAAARLGPKLLPIGFRGRNWVQGFGVDFKSGVPQIATYFDPGTRRRLLRQSLATDPQIGQAAERIRASRLPPDADLLQRATRMDFGNYLAEDILVKVDRASMLSSLEVRAPWLDRSVIEFAFGRVPGRLKATSVGRKILPKLLARRLLPAGFDLVRKQGFSIPLGAWLRQSEWGDFFREVLLDPGADLFDRDCVTGLLDGQQRGRANSERLFALVLFELWRREYRIAI